MRATISLLPPGVKGTTKRMALLGQVWAWAVLWSAEPALRLDASASYSRRVKEVWLMLVCEVGRDCAL